jgi:hypothetical protein
MSLTPTIQSVTDLFQKLEREGYRTLHCRNATHRADHFLNFCITAHSMRDHLLEHLNKVGTTDAKVLIDRWKQSPAIVAAADIANSQKHFVLRNRKSEPIPPSTKGVHAGTSRYLDVYELPNGELAIKEARVPDYFVRLSDGTKHELCSFMHEVLVFWKQELQHHDVKLRRQSFASLSGKAQGLRLG